MCLINVAHECFITQAGKKSKPALINFMGQGGWGPRKTNTPKQANVKSKLPRGGETDILPRNIVCKSISSQKQTQ